jgi:peptide/nickel transport system substrate-binding protein
MLAACGGDDDAVDEPSAGTAGEESTAGTAGEESTAGTAGEEPTEESTEDTLPEVDETPINTSDVGGVDVEGGDLVPEGTLRVARTLTWPPSFNPHFDQDAPNLGLFTWVYEGLIRQAADGTFVPHLAKGWEFSEDGLTLTFALHENVVFSDGSPFNAETAKASIEYVLSGPPDQVLPGVQAQLSNIVSAEATDEFTLTLTLAEQRPVETLVWLGKHAGLMVHPDSLGRANEAPIGTGPFTVNLDESTADKTHVVLEANSNYWIPGVIGFERVEMDTIADITSHRQAFEAGQYDVAVNNLTLGPASRGSTAMAGGNPRYTFVINDWQGQQIPQLANRDVRCAIGQTINRAGIAEILGLPQETFITQWGRNQDDYAWNADFQPLEFDLEAARAAFEATGEEPFSFETRTFPGGIANIMTAWKGALSELGIEMNNSVLDPPSGAQMFQNFAQGEYPIQWIPFEQPHPLLALQQVAMPDGSLNSAKAAPEGVVELVESAQTKSSEEAEAELTEALQIMYDECIWFHLWADWGGFLVSDDIAGVEKVSGLPVTFWPQGVHRTT